MVKSLSCDRRLAGIVGLLGLALGVSAPAPAWSQSAPIKVVGVSAVSVGLPSVAAYWIGKPLGFQAEEGIDADMRAVTGGNAAQAVQLVISGQADLCITSVETVLVPASQGKDTGLVFVYNFYQRPTWRLLVAAGGGIASVAQLKGKRIGIPSPGNPAEPMLKAFLSEAGLGMTDADINSVGIDAPAAQGLKGGQISALLTVSLTAAVWQAAGYDFTAMPSPKQFDNLIGASAAVSRASLKDSAKRDAIIRFLRVWAKAIVFARSNPEAAVKLDYQMFPEVKPRNVSDAEALRQGVQAAAVVIPDYSRKNGKWGLFPDAVLTTYADFLGIKVVDADRLYSNELIDAVNDFDEQAVVKKASEFK
jgi:NitT/TauT family transport system substrate-binding protein